MIRWIQFSLVCTTLAALASFHPAARPAPASAAQAQAADPFPVPKEGLSIKVSPGKEPTLMDVVEQFERATGWHAVLGVGVRSVLQNSSTGLTRDLEAKPEDVYFAFETLLSENDMVVAYLSMSEPRFFKLTSLQGVGRQQVRNSVSFVPPERLPFWTRHPATLITTLITLDATDVRTLSNSLRATFTDASTQSVVPIGNTNSLLIVGFAPAVSATVAMLQLANEEARKAGGTTGQTAPPAVKPAKDGAPK